MPEFLSDPSALLPRILAFICFGIALVLAIRLVTKLGIRVVEVFFVMVLTAVAAFFIGGWYFDRARTSKLVRGVQKAEKQIKDLFK